MGEPAAFLSVAGEWMPPIQLAVMKTP